MLNSLPLVLKIQLEIFLFKKNIYLNTVLKPADKSIDQVVISASRMKQKISDFTISMDVIRAELIENNNATSFDKLIEQYSGIF
jgi:outer membrane cobalamin receptor